MNVRGRSILKILLAANLLAIPAFAGVVWIAQSDSLFAAGAVVTELDRAEVFNREALKNFDASYGLGDIDAGYYRSTLPRRIVNAAIENQAALGLLAGLIAAANAITLGWVLWIRRGDEGGKDA